MKSIVFAAISPHPPILLPSVGSKEDRNEVKKTIKNLEILGERLKKSDPDSIIISSPHPDWGFNVPRFFLAKDFKKEIRPYLIESGEPKDYFEKGREIFNSLEKEKNYALIASGDLSHFLKETGPYGFHSDGPQFDKELIESLKKKDIKNILMLDKKYPEAGECGLRSFVFMLGILEESKINYSIEVMSYEYPFGVGYLTANFNL